MYRNTRHDLKGSAASLATPNNFVEWPLRRRRREKIKKKGSEETRRAKGDERSGDLKRGRGRGREWPEDASRDWPFPGRRDDFRMIILSVARFFANLLRAHKPTETLEKRPASTRLRSKEVARSESRRCCYRCWLLERRHRWDRTKKRCFWELAEKRHVGSARASEDELK